MKSLPDRFGMSGEGYTALWGWFGLDRASFLTLPRVLMHEMPDDWQGKMAALLAEYGEVFPGVYQLPIGTRVQATAGGKLTKFPDWLLNYRHPDGAAIDELRPSAEP